MADVVRIGVLCVIYVATAKFGLSLDAVSGFAAAVWPPTGIALVALVLYGPQIWPGIALGALLVNVSAGAPVLVASGMALGNTLEALLGTVLLTRVIGFRPSLERLRDVLGLVVLAAGLSTLVSATIGVTSGWLGGSIPAGAYRHAWRIWWLGDALGDLVVAPLLFVWSRRGRAALPRGWVAEAIVLLLAVSVLSLAVFGNFLVPTPLHFPYIVFPVLIWAAMRLGLQGSVSAIALVSATAIWGTAQGIGPFDAPTLHEGLFLLQAYMSVVAVTTLVIAAVVAERQQVDAIVQEQHERFEVTLFSIGDGVIATDSQGRVTFMNPVATALTGWPEAEALGKDITAVFQIINEYTRQVVENPIAKVIRAGTVVGLANHTLLIARNGGERPIDDSGAPMRDPQGRLLGIVVVFRDITERRRAEEARTRLAAIVESSEDAILGKTLAGIITSWNRGAERLYGYTAEEVLGQPIAMLAPPEHPDEIPALLARLAQGEAIDHYETVRMRRDGQRILVSLTISPIRDPVGTIVGASAIERDITARRQAEAEVERRRRETALLAEIAQGLSASLDLDTVLQRVVAGAQDLCGSERVFLALREPGSDALVGRYEVGAPRAGYVGLRIEPGQGLSGQVLRTGRPWRTADYIADERFRKVAVAGIRAGGHLAILAVPILMSGQVEGVLYASNPATHPFSDQDEEILERLAAHAAVAMHNAQLYHQAQVELAERRHVEAQLTASLQEKEVLLKEIHHRVKNNLQIISSLLSLQSDAITDPYLLAQFQDSQDRVRSMALVHETLYQSQDLARLDMVPYLYTLSAQLLQSYDVEPSRITLQIKVERLLLNLDQAIPCGLILNELLTNAFKYAFPPGDAGVVHIELHSVAGQQARLVVRDTGVGFPAELDFCHTETLGLQLVGMLTEQLGGTITLERVGGTSFTLTFPMLTPEA